MDAITASKRDGQMRQHSLGLKSLAARAVVRREHSPKNLFAASSMPLELRDDAAATMAHGS